MRMRMVCWQVERRQPHLPGKALRRLVMWKIPHASLHWTNKNHAIFCLQIFTFSFISGFLGPRPTSFLLWWAPCLRNQLRWQPQWCLPAHATTSHGVRNHTAFMPESRSRIRIPKFEFQSFSLALYTSCPQQLQTPSHFWRQTFQSCLLLTLTCAMHEARAAWYYRWCVRLVYDYKKNSRGWWGNKIWMDYKG